MVEVTLTCALVREGGVDVFSVVIDSSKVVGLLKKATADELKYTGRADKLRLFLAKTLKTGDTDEGEAKKEDTKQVYVWMTEAEVKGGVPDISGLEELDAVGAPLNVVGLSETDVQFLVTKELAKAKKTPVHVLVVDPGPALTGKRTRVDEWFSDDDFSVQVKKFKVGEDQCDELTRYFNMEGFPPLAHPMGKYAKIMERDAYGVIFGELMCKVKESFDLKSGANMVVTGNPGTGKSRFYLYCIFQLLLAHREDVKELGSFDVVMNFDDEFHWYDGDRKEFTELSMKEVKLFRKQHQVLRLIEGKSSSLTGWTGASILFASPGLVGMNDYAKVESYTYILPAWTFEELQDYNVLLDDSLRLDENVLTARYNKFGGIPRFIFTKTERENDGELDKAVVSFSALDIISYAKSQSAVKDGNYSHRVLEMVPSSPDYRATFHLDFLSNHIADRIVSRVTDESFEAVSAFAIAQTNDDSGCTSVVQGKIYEMLCHKSFTLAKSRTLIMHSLSSQSEITVELGKMPMVRFSSLDDIVVTPNTYYRPNSKTFGALDAFFMHENDCIGLQMTINQSHGIKAAPMIKFLKWLKGAGIAGNHFRFAFVVPSSLVPSFKKQTMRTTKNLVTAKPDVYQFVTALDMFGNDN